MSREGRSAAVASGGLRCRGGRACHRARSDAEAAALAALASVARDIDALADHESSSSRGDARAPSSTASTRSPAVGRHHSRARPREFSTVEPPSRASATHCQAEDGGQSHAERPKLVPLGDDTYVVLWERWDGAAPEFAGTWGMVIDAGGAALVPAAWLSDAHLPRGDDAFPLAGAAAWITGDAAARQLDIHIVDATLNYRHVVVQ